MAGGRRCRDRGGPPLQGPGGPPLQGRPHTKHINHEQASVKFNRLLPSISCEQTEGRPCSARERKDGKEGGGGCVGGGGGDPPTLHQKLQFITNGVSLRRRSAIRNTRSLYPFNSGGAGGVMEGGPTPPSPSAPPPPQSHSKLPFRNCFSIRNDQSIYLQQAACLLTRTSNIFPLTRSGL